MMVMMDVILLFHLNCKSRTMLEQTSEDLTAWKNEMKSYEKQKRTKKPFGKEFPRTSHVTHQQIKQKQAVFNPVLQTYNDPVNEHRRNETDDYVRAKSLMNHIRQTKKYERPYDIVNLHSVEQKTATEPQSNGKKLGPIRNAYNVINNSKLPDFYFHNREMRLPVEREKVLIQNNPKEFNIVTGIYYKNNEERTRQEDEKEKQATFGKYWKTHDYDPVFGKFYDEQREIKYQEELKKLEIQHGKDYESRLPPSYHLPQGMQTIDQKRMNAKKRYQMKYYIEDEYNRRNHEDEEKHEQVIKNRVHNGRIEEHKSKQFDIITMKQYSADRTEQLFNKNKKNTQSAWEKVQNDAAKIKTGGFN